ncbi:MAG: hypothetical protein ABFC96_00120, partial [Thermoguttaceae bacterium]
MMFDRLVALLPSEGLEDLELERPDEEAAQLLSAWSGLWHPAILASAEQIPIGLPAASPPSDLTRLLVVVPDCCLGLLPEDWLPQAQAANACVLRNLRNRKDAVAAALQCLGPTPAVDPNLVADFLALGYCHLQVELLTRKLRYSSNLDQEGLRTAALAAAREALAGNAEAARGHLQAAFDRLHEAREYYYPVDTQLFDLTLLAPGTSGEALRGELSGGLPRNILCSGETLEGLAAREPETLDALKQALNAGRAAIVGGEYDELPLPLLEPDAIAAQLARGLPAYERHLGRRPTIYGRRRFGLTPALPQILERFGFTAAFHCTLDDGRFPTGNQARVQWEGLDGTSIDSLGIVPLDASRDAGFLQLAEKLGDSMGIEQSGVVVLAHWPGRAACWYDDLRRIAAYGSVLGKFSTMAEYFNEVAMSGHYAQYKPDEYRSPYLKQDVAAGRPDPISRWVRYFRRRTQLDAWQSVHLLAQCVSDDQGPPTDGAQIETSEQARLAAAIEDCLADEGSHSALDDDLAKRLQRPLADFARRVTDANSSERGSLVVNPRSFARQECVEAHPLIDVPAMGFAWVASAPAASDQVSAADAPAARRGWFGLGRAKVAPPLAEGNVLQNEFCQIHFDPETGAIRSISDYDYRDPRLGQQIALRLGGTRGGEADYSIMAADALVCTSAGPTLGEMVARGRLLDRDGRHVAAFKQTTRLWRGSRLIELLIELDIDRQPGPNPWDSYYAVRFAWKDETAELRRSMNWASVPTELAQFESPQFVDLHRGKQRTTLLCGGLPYHRRFGRKLDTLLVVAGESARRFRLGIGIDVPQPMAAAIDFIAPPLVLPDQPRPPTPSGWLFHLDCRNVLATHWAPLRTSSETTAGESESAQGSSSGRRLAGVRIRLLETEGRSVRLGLRSFRAVA